MERLHQSVPDGQMWSMSWVAYFVPLLKYGIAIAILNAISFVPWWVTALLAARLVYKLLDLAFTVIALDSQGVWLHRGFLPWSKGMIGVKWRDID
ncbi:hypothetical protein [Aurantiacibacter gangjinensis]|uniref:hypothetical protein n=1 Tax=Aurantiacibacter gangjinensis TaxID=502682 RepID=UPI000A987C3A|nr:hypothetical protein [Aurantiacibacter gangjinensis]